MSCISQVYKDVCTGEVSHPYLCHQLSGTVNNIQFCPYEDVLGVGHGQGFTSLIVPGLSL